MLMIWFRSIGTLEIILILFFTGFYLAYIYRVISIGRRLRTSYNRVFYKVFLRSLYFILLIVALLGPSFGESTREVKAVGKDMFICVDLSESMNANDVQPTRLEKIKFELKNIVREFNSDRIGIIIFSSEAFVQCPLTYDQNALNLFIETLNTNLVPKAGTDFAPPLEMALKKLDEDDGNTLQQKSKIIILISDGEDFGDQTDQVVDNIQDSNIKLFTLGVGTASGSRIQTRAGFKTDRTGREVITRLNSNTMKSIAIKTEGKYYEINESQNDVSRLINTINQIEGELRDARMMDVSANKFYYFLAIALLLIVFDLITSVKPIKV
jgi:Ca-activated chloride channel family protein